MRIQHNIMAMSAYRNYTNNVAARKKNLEKGGGTGFVRHFASCQAFTAKRTGRL